MTSRCLYCDKRLSLFHGKKNPFCSDAHEDSYTERQALSGLGRLRDNYLEVDSRAPGRTLAAALPSPAKPDEQFAYPELEPGFFDDEPAPDNHAPRSSADGIPATAEYMIHADALQPAPPSIPFRDAARAAFHALAWTRPVLLDPAQIGPPLVSLPLERENPDPLPPPLVTSLQRLPMPLLRPAHLPAHFDNSKISAIPGEPRHYSIPQFESQPQAIHPDAPPLITSLASPPITALRAPDPDAPRTFRDCPLDMALPEPVYQPHRQALKFVTAPSAPAPPADISPQRGAIEYLPSPQPLRFRMLLDLRVAAFRTSTHRLFPALLAPLTWNAAPPESLNWPLALQRRRPGPILPKLAPVLRPKERHL